MSPFWFPGGDYLGFSRGDLVNALEPWRTRPDGAGRPELLLAGVLVAQGRTSPRSDWLVFRTVSATGPARDIVGFRPGIDNALLPLIGTAEYTEQGPALSPDGSLLAYSSDVSGREEVYVTSFPNVESSRLTVSVNGGSNPRWDHSRAAAMAESDRRYVIVLNWFEEVRDQFDNR